MPKTKGKQTVDSGTEVIHLLRVRVGFGLSAEHGTVEDDVCDVVEDVRLNVDHVWLAENDDLDGVRWFPRWVFSILHLGDYPDQVNIRHPMSCICAY